MAREQAVTCHLRYELDMGKVREFEAYARAWMVLIERYGGRHHGYFLPRSVPEGARISFPEVGREGEANVAIALFSFPSERAYLRYRELVGDDPDCEPAAALYRDTGCFVRYERLFLEEVERSV